MDYQIELFPNDKAVLSVKTGDKYLQLLYRRLTQYNKDLTKTNTEEVSVIVCNRMIVGTVTAYKGQTGIIFVWDPMKNRIVHVSDGEYAVRAILHNKMVYSLHFISLWGKEPKFQLCCMNLGTKDPCIAPVKIPIPEAVTYHKWLNNENIELKVLNQKLHVVFDRDEFEIKI